IMILLEPQPFVTGLADLRILLATLLGATVLPVLQRLPSPRPLTAAMVAVAVVAAGSIVTLAVVDDYGRARPRPVSLGYAVFADTSGHQIVGAGVDGAPLPVGTVLSPTAGAWGWGFGYAGPPPTGSELTLRVRGNGPLRIRVVTTIASLPSGVGAPALPP